MSAMVFLLLEKLKNMF